MLFLRLLVIFRYTKAGIWIELYRIQYRIINKQFIKNEPLPRPPTVQYALQDSSFYGLNLPLELWKAKDCKHRYLLYTESSSPNYHSVEHQQPADDVL